MKPKTLYILNEHSFERIYNPALQREIAQYADIYAPAQTREAVVKQPDLLKELEVIFSGWGAPVMDQAFLDMCPKLKAVFYGAGSIKSAVTDAFWKRGIVITSSYAANAVPVAEFTFAQIILALKRHWQEAIAIRENKVWRQSSTIKGTYQSSIGIIGLGMIGQLVCERLKTLDVSVAAYDPYIDAGKAKALGVDLVSLKDIFQRCDVVSLHAPNIPETAGMITGEHFEVMKPDATCINTSRGKLIREDEMIAVLKKRTDLFAFLDVVHPEPPADGSPLYTLPNVVLTPHIAGSMGNECARMGEYALQEFKRYLNGEPLRWQIDKQTSEKMA